MWDDEFWETEFNRDNSKIITKITPKNEVRGRTRKEKNKLEISFR